MSLLSDESVFYLIEHVTNQAGKNNNGVNFDIASTNIPIEKARAAKEAYYKEISTASYTVTTQVIMVPVLYTQIKKDNATKCYGDCQSPPCLDTEARQV
jgi:hypothetical protein